MRYTPKQASMILQQMKDVIACEEADEKKLWGMWHKLIGYRAQLIAMTLASYLGGIVHSGPFKGMRLTQPMLARMSAPMQLGVFEHELHHSIEDLVAQSFSCVLNIGCSFGYYAVGLARRLPNAMVYARDINPIAQEQCTAMALLNEVQDRVEVGGEFCGKDFSAFSGLKTLVFMDIEGSEQELLDPCLYPELNQMTILVELHEVYHPGVVAEIRQRFEATHDVRIVENDHKPFEADLSFIPQGTFDAFDRLIMTWEERSGSTPWGILVPKETNV